MAAILPSSPSGAWGPWQHRLHRQLLADPDLLPDGTSLLLAVSGGQDSLALTRLLLELQPLHAWSLQLWHGNHGWRSDAEANALHLQALVEQWELPLNIDVATPPPASEAAARRWRYGLLRQRAEQLGCPLVLTGHTGSDRAETLLFNLIRGSSPRGLASLRSKRQLGPGITLVRPLLSFSRADTAACCAALQLPVWHDSSNNDPRFSRNRMRQEVLPLLEQLRPGATSHIARLAGDLEILDGELAALEQLALEQLLIANEQTPAAKGAGLDRQRWQALPANLRPRLLHRWILHCSGLSLSHGALAELCMRLSTAGSQGQLPLGQGWRLLLERCMLTIEAPLPIAPSHQ